MLLPEYARRRRKRSRDRRRDMKRDKAKNKYKKVQGSRISEDEGDEKEYRHNRNKKK